MPENTNPSAVSRRTVAKGIAWTVPAVVAAGAVPAFAVSQPPVVISGIGLSCKHSGTGNNDFPKGYHIRFVFRNTSTESVTFTLPGIASLPGGPGSSQTNCVPNGNNPVLVGGELTVTVPANSPAYHVVIHYYSNNSANGAISFPYSWVGDDPNNPSATSGSTTFNGSLSGDVCDSTPIGISDQHACGGGSGTIADPLCIASPNETCTLP